MPQVTLDKGKLVYIDEGIQAWIRSFSRILLNGPPHSGKTTSILTFPGPRTIAVVPGEMGYSSILETDETKLYYWIVDQQMKQEQAKALVDQYSRVVVDLVGQKPQTLGLDGIHKLYRLIQKSYGYPDNEELFGEKSFGKGHNFIRSDFERIVNSALTSQIPHVVCTSYDGPEPEGDSGKTVQYPDFPGAMAKGVMGMFPAVFATSRVTDGTIDKFTWKLQALGKTQGAGMHLPKEIKDKFPKEVKADWANVAKYIEEAAAIASKQLT